MVVKPLESQDDLNKEVIVMGWDEFSVFVVEEVEKPRSFPSFILPKREDRKLPTPNLKPLPNNLKYLNLQGNAYPIIISSLL